MFQQHHNTAIADLQQNAQALKTTFTQRPTQDHSAATAKLLLTIIKQIAEHQQQMFICFTEHLHFINKTIHQNNWKTIYHLLNTIIEQLYSYYKYSGQLTVASIDGNGLYTIHGVQELTESDQAPIDDTLYFFMEKTVADYLEQLLHTLTIKKYQDYIGLLILLTSKTAAAVTQLNLTQRENELNQHISNIIAQGLQRLPKKAFLTLNRAHTAGPIADFMRFPALYEINQKNQAQHYQPNETVGMSTLTSNRYKGEFGIYQQENEVLLKQLSYFEQARQKIARQRHLPTPTVKPTIDSDYQRPEYKIGRELFEDELQRRYHLAIVTRNTITSPERMACTLPLNEEIDAYSPASFYHFIEQAIGTALDQYNVTDQLARNQPELALTVFKRYLQRVNVNKMVNNKSASALYYYLSSHLYNTAQSQINTVAELYFPHYSQHKIEMLKEAANALSNCLTEAHIPGNTALESTLVRQFHELHQQKIDVHHSSWAGRGQSRFSLFGWIRRHLTGSATWIPDTITLAQATLATLPNTLTKKEHNKIIAQNVSTLSHTPPTVGTALASIDAYGSSDRLSAYQTTGLAEDSPTEHSTLLAEETDNDNKKVTTPHRYQLFSKQLVGVYNTGLKPYGSRSWPAYFASFFGTRLQRSTKDYQALKERVQPFNYC